MGTPPTLLQQNLCTLHRSTRYGLLDSKRCPHAGSCVGEKCALVNRTTKLLELQIANDYPGVTGCMESCGGPDCDCFYPSSGCFFHRIYLLANDENVYVIFRCSNWRESVTIRVKTVRPRTAIHQQVINLVPNVPSSFRQLKITLSSVSVPPTPFLDNLFITDGNRTAMAPRQYESPLGGLYDVHFFAIMGFPFDDVVV
ncbi:hypothetical protein GCK32_022244 [Trichostrongylus colubriformis]|uniref:Phlebovirus glycoprotein G2 fusion domain-containing protein n=1 Tax=Trichostrongylus colubriformis TaxID=6319 RepID=A0AAN8IUW6_TRICO